MPEGDEAASLLVTQMNELRPRLRNHLQNMISLISLQIRRARSAETIAALEDLRARFSSITSIYIDLDDSSDHPIALDEGMQLGLVQAPRCRRSIERGRRCVTSQPH